MIKREKKKKENLTDTGNSVVCGDRQAKGQLGEVEEGMGG